VSNDISSTHQAADNHLKSSQPQLKNLSLFLATNFFEKEKTKKLALKEKVRTTNLD
jgi:hypothetical protein